MLFYKEMGTVNIYGITKEKRGSTTDVRLLMTLRREGEFILEDLDLIFKNLESSLFNSLLQAMRYNRMQINEKHSSFRSREWAKQYFLVTQLKYISSFLKCYKTAHMRSLRTRYICIVRWLQFGRLQFISLQGIPCNICYFFLVCNVGEARFGKWKARCTIIDKFLEWKMLCELEFVS